MGPRVARSCAYIWLRTLLVGCQEMIVCCPRHEVKRSCAVVLGVACVLCGCAATTTKPQDLYGIPYSPASHGSQYPSETVTLRSATPGHAAYRVSHQGHNRIFYSMESIRAGVEREASTFCDQKRRVMRPLAETTYVPPRMTIWGGLPRFEIIFECLDIADRTVGPAAIDAK
jgi:hypothetical protein